MKIKIHVKEKHLNFTFLLPLRFIKSKIIYKNVFEKNNVKITKNTIDEMYTILKKFKKEYKNFQLVEVISDECKVLIKL